MNRRQHPVRLIWLSFCLLLSISACTSGPATRYYTLFPDKSLASLAPSRAPSLTSTLADASVGIGPVILPEYVDQLSVVSLTQSQRLHIASHDAWAGDLKTMVTRVVADDISRLLDINAVWAFPWDNRRRPDYQIRIVFEEFSGQRGEDVTLRAKWSLLDKTGSKTHLVRAEEFTQATAADDVASYVAAMNSALNQLSQAIAQELVLYSAQSTPQ